MNSEKKQANEMDKGLIDHLTRHFFSVFTNKNGQSPQWQILDEVCLPEIIIIKKQGLEQEIYNLTSFLAPRKKLLLDGTLQDFEEKEIAEETKIVGSIAQRSVRYQKEGLFNGVAFEEFGNKLFQFIKTKQGWKINSVVWEDEK